MSAPRTSAPISLCGSLSLHPVRLGAVMHEAGYRALGLPYVYVPFAVGAEGLQAAVHGMRALGVRGLGVSMPFKLQVLPMLDALSDLAREIGAVNTIVNEDGTLVGHNTDAEGAVLALGEAVGQLRSRRVLVIGAGGAARAVAFGLRSVGCELALTNRTHERARELAAELGVRCLALGDVRPESFDIVVNASSAGMDLGRGSEHSPLEAEAIRAGSWVMDIVYKPLETRLLREARERGAQVIHGGAMLLFQAARQFELYTGRKAPLAAMRAAQERELGATKAWVS